MRVLRAMFNQTVSPLISAFKCEYASLDAYTCNYNICVTVPENFVVQGWIQDVAKGQEGRGDR